MQNGTLATLALDIDGPEPLDTAIANARRFGMHLEVLCAQTAQFDISPYLTPDAVTVTRLLEEGLEALKEVRQKAEARLSREEIAWSVSVPQREGSAVAIEMAQRLRFADLVCLPRAVVAEPARARLFEAMLYNSHAPLLLTDRDLGDVGTVVIGWDGSDVALSAVRAALPILAQAKSVEIVMVDPPYEGFGQALAVMLSRRGIEPELTALPKGSRRVADTLATRAREVGADLLVAGAYGHARLREALIGGVTRDLLAPSDLPLLLAR
ncbi:universal stress protein [Pseudoroseicyclus sp. H15]